MLPNPSKRAAIDVGSMREFPSPKRGAGQDPKILGKGWTGTSMHRASNDDMNITSSEHIALAEPAAEDGQPQKSKLQTQTSSHKKHRNLRAQSLCLISQARELPTMALRVSNQARPLLEIFPAVSSWCYASLYSGFDTITVKLGRYSISY